uniref:NADH-ubiquinone oxidoreductase chain 5 n=1 Tax=Endelus continentalis TaxID=2984121 RepID=A0A977TQ62_9COLE|nr:NADH dehydrogenase subunit 5 [Endelus continentalis]UXX50478.1 NADH dehydrogenase subunit 5 [Endelus continentalis]
MSVCLIFSIFLFLMSFFLFFSSLIFLLNELTYFLEFEIFVINSCPFIMSLIFDWMSLLFSSFVLFISSMVIYYSSDYMIHDLNLSRFIMLIFMFVMSMLLMIFSPNLISILLGWDGLGLVSYCLVIYYQNVKSSSAGMLTAISNRLGDVAILMSIAWFINYGNWSFIFYLDYLLKDFSMQFILLLIIFASMTKSAQIPFSAWLPAAMAAPTPVSSLVHSSTLVTAGVYLLIRFFHSLSDTIMLFLLLMSCVTMFMAGLGANFEYDLKKIIALSTLSQLGLMISILALGSNLLSFFHLLSHALFKALLFMCAGSILHDLGNCQDVRYMGSMLNFKPLTCSMFIICNLSLGGLPFLSGFYSKDLILEFISGGFLNVFIYLMYFISTGLTVSYSIRLVYYVVISDFNYFSTYSLSDNSFNMSISMLGLIFLVIFGGCFLSWILFSIPYFICLPLMLKLMTFMVILLGFLFGLLSSSLNYGFFMGSMNMPSLLFISLMWNMPFLSTYGINFYFLYLGGIYYKYVDQGWFEELGSQNLYFILIKLSSFFSMLNKNLKFYLMFLIFWILFVLLMI